MTHVLVVDDDPTIREVIGDVMKEEGFCVSFAHSGQSALQQLAARRPDLVVLDVQIPEGNGEHVLRAMQSRPYLRDIPVIIVSTGDVCERQEHGTVTYLAKPLDLDHLVHLVIEAIGAPDEQELIPD